MSYARFGWDNSDVYVFLDVGGYFTCCACTLAGTEWQSEHFESTATLIAHLEEHRAVGECVPDETFEELAAEREANDEWIAKQR